MTGPLGNGDPPPLLDGVGLEVSAISGPTDPAELLAERLAIDLAEAWRAGRCFAVEEILETHPPVKDHPRAAIRLIYEEICLRQELGWGGDLAAELRVRFPRYRDELSILLEGHRLLAADTEAPGFPQVGDLWEGARLLADLGRGGAGRVYLATQPDLADRPVVLKVTPNLGDEHLALARLQHTHIVPLYSVRVVPDGSLRVLCMPYLGCTTFARLLGALRGQPARDRAGSDIARVIVEAEAGSPVPGPLHGPGMKWLARASYEHAICWIGSCLAQALHYAHERGLVHLDVKPSNVLLAADGTPMLLDFHLARGPILADEPAMERVGGTLAYMSPEQAGAMEDARRGRTITAGVDERSDIYSLGLILYEALGGTMRDVSGASARRLPRINPRVSPALAALIARCLDRDPGRRYPNAMALADDLRRHLADLPLAGVANRSLRERWRKWRRRRPHAPALLAMGGAVLGVACLIGMSLTSHRAQRLHEARAALARVPEDGRADAAAVRDLEQTLVLVRGTPGAGDLAHQLVARLDLVQRVGAADRLHAIIDRFRFEYAGTPPGRSEAPSLIALCADLWALRGLVLDGAGSPVRADLDRQVREDLLDLVILSAGLAVRETPGDGGGSAIRRDALRRLDEAETLLGAGAALEHQRAALARAEGLDELAHASALRAAAHPPKTCSDYYALGLSQLQAGDLGHATRALEEACRMQPQAFWPNYYRGLCAERSSRATDAVEAFSISIAGRPDSAACYAHRAQAWQALGRPDLAERDLDRALKLDPRPAGTWTNLGVLKIRAGRHLEALADLRRALDAGGDPATVHYNLALAHHALGDDPQARIHARAALRHNPGHTSARALAGSFPRD